MLKVGNTVIRKKDTKNGQAKPKKYEIVARQFIDWVMEDDGMFPVYTYALKDVNTGKKVPGMFEDSELNRVL